MGWSLTYLSIFIRNSSRKLPSSQEKWGTYRNISAEWGAATPAWKPRKKPFTFYPLSPCMFIARSEMQSSTPGSLSTLSGKDVACKYKSLLAQEKPHCRRQHTMKSLCIWEARGSISSVSLHTNSAALHFCLDFLACIINKFYSWASNNERWV